jgi:TPR repeat protein
MNFQVAIRAGLAHQWRGARGEDFMYMRCLTYPKANLFFLLAALTYAATAVCQQDGDQLQFQRQNLSSESSETSYLLKQAQNGDRIAQFNVASRYLQGVEVPQDYKNAAIWYERAAEQGLTAAQFVMGFLYEGGKGVRRDYTRALGYYRSAAEQGHTTAANNLATLYRSEDEMETIRGGYR